MSLIGKLEQLGLSNVLQGIEAYSKTGLLLIKQKVQRVELYFRDGRLLCIGPLRAKATLGDRLLQAKVISSQALQEAVLAIGIAEPSETRIAITLMDLGYVSQEDLRTWATQEALTVIQRLLKWQSGEVHFENGVQPPVDRLLVALSAVSLLPSHSSMSPTGIEIASPGVQAQKNASTLAPTVAEPPSQVSTSQDNFDTSDATSPFSSLESSMSAFTTSTATGSGTSYPLVRPTPITKPLPPMRVDTSFMRPEMILIPADLSDLREQNPQVHLTPEQWRLLTKVDGRTSLLMICQALAISPDFACQVAGELIVQGLLHISRSAQMPMKELPPIARGSLTPGRDHVSSISHPLAAITSMADPLPPFSSSVPFETQSQWGNGH